MIDKILYTFLIAVYSFGMPCALVWSVRSGKKRFCPGVSAELFCSGVSRDDPLYKNWLRSVDFQYKVR